jgi:ATP-binding cassette, subfamily B, bacterial
LTDRMAKRPSVAAPDASPGYYRVRLRRAVGQLRYLPLAISLAWQAARGWTVVWVVLLLAQGLVPAVLVLMTRTVVNALVALTSAGITPARAAPVALLVIVVAGLLALAEILRVATAYVRTVQAERITDHVAALTQARSLNVDLAFYDLPEFYDHLHRARNDASQLPLAVLERLGSLMQSAVTLAAMMLVLLPYGAWLPVALLLSTVPAVFVVVRGARRYHEWYLRTTADQRQVWYLDWLMSSRETAAELRLFDLGGHFQARYRGLRTHLRTERLDLAAAEGRADLAATGIGLVVTAGTLGVMVWRALGGILTLGDLALMYQAFSQGQQLMRALLGHVGQLYRNSLFLGDLVTFLGLEPSITAPAEPRAVPDSPPAIRFRDVTFSYTAQRGPVLAGFDLTVPAGHTVAIVGRNGAGKSTLIKLLCRFYDPTDGAVEVGGVDVRELDPAELRRHITVLFQEPVQYGATAWENIAIADVDAPPAAIPEAARQAGADGIIAQLPEGYNTLLGVWLRGGTDLSVGEQQRLALARAYLRRAPIMVLDEPTSAMDPWAESAWFERFRDLAHERTVLLITHRFSTARFADVIHVMEAGQVVESGTHDELLARAGRYADAWRRQTSGFAADTGPAGLETAAP